MWGCYESTDRIMKQMEIKVLGIQQWNKVKMDKNFRKKSNYEECCKNDQEKEHNESGNGSKRMSKLLRVGKKMLKIDINDIQMWEAGRSKNKWEVYYK